MCNESGSPLNPLERKKVRDGVKACTRCGLRARCTAPVPFSGSSTPRLVVVGEAPGKQEDTEGAPFVGPSGQLVRQWLTDAGWATSDIAFVNAVSCYPNRTPTKDEVNACQANIHDQLAHLDCGRLLVLGGIAVQALRNQEIRIGEIRGLWWRVDRVALDRPTWALATWHPSAVLRNHRLGFEAFDDVSYMSLVIQKKLAPTLGTFCVKCGAPGVDFHVDIPYCARHLPKG